jgi:hypothetical protein
MTPSFRDDTEVKKEQKSEKKSSCDKLLLKETLRDFFKNYRK